MIKLTHRHRNLWLESGLLDDFLAKKSGLPIPINGKIDSMEVRAQRFAKDKAKTAKNSFDEYCFVVGAMMEVLTEFYMKLMVVSNYNLRIVEDTSDNRYEEGFDYLGFAGPQGDMPVAVQVKWRDDPKHKFSKHDLWTMTERATREGILPNNLYLVVISSPERVTANVLSYKGGFSAEWWPKMTIITGRLMDDKIGAELRSSRGLSPIAEFWTLFKESLIFSQ